MSKSEQIEEFNRRHHAICEKLSDIQGDVMSIADDYAEHRKTPTKKILNLYDEIEKTLNKCHELIVKKA